MQVKTSPVPGGTGDWLKVKDKLLFFQYDISLLFIFANKIKVTVTFFVRNLCYTLMEMAKLTRDDVLKLARLARLHLSDEEVAQFQKEISNILGFVEQLQTVDLTGIEPTYQVTGLKDVMRPDVIKDYGITPEALLKNAPATEDGHIKVKRMLQ